MNTLELTTFIKEIVEQTIDEAEYPASFDVNTFRSLPSFKTRLDYVKDKLTYLAKGSSRAAFDIDQNTVMKIALNKKGIEQNGTEADIGTHSDWYPVAQVTYVGDNYFWIEMEKARKCTPKEFQKIAGIDLNTFTDVLIYWFNEYNNQKNYGPPPKNYNEIKGENELVQETMKMMGEHNIMPQDFRRASSWGIVKRNGQDVLVLIDYGLSQSTFDTFYAKKK